MRATPVNLIGGFYADDTRPWSVQDTVNWLPVAAEVDGTLTPSKLSTPPGLNPYQKIGTGPVRGMYNCEGQMFVVSGRTMYRISNSGVGIPVGTIPGVGRVSISHNQFKGGNQVLVTNGSPGGGYVYDTQTQQFNRISDPGFPGSLMTAYVDSYLLGVEPQGRFWFHSNLADANDYNTLDRYEAEAAPDRIVGIAVSQFEVWTFGERTTECFGNTGGATGTFQSRRTSIERGCASRWTIQNLDNSIFWLGDDGIVYRLDGYGARRVSTVPLERAISANRLQDAFAFTWEDKGHKVYYLTMPDGRTWGYDVVTGIWHRRESYGLNRWRINDSVRWNGAWYGGDFQDGRIWRLDWEYPAEGDQPMVSERTSPVMHDSQSTFNLTNVELILGVGQEQVEMSGEFPTQPPRPEISGQAPDGIKGIGYEYSYIAFGGTGALTFSISGGSLPSGVSMSSIGELSGTPAMSGSYTFTVRVTDSKGMWAELIDVVRVIGGVVALATPTHLFERQGGILRETRETGLAGAVSIAISPSSSLIAGGLIANPPLLRIRKATTLSGSYVGGPSPDIAPDGAVSSVDFGPHDYLAVGWKNVTNRMSVYKVTQDSCTLVATVTGSANGGSRVKWSPDGRRLLWVTYTGAPDYGGRVYEFTPGDGGLGGYISFDSLAAPSGVEHVAWSPDGRWIAVGSGVRTEVADSEGSKIRIVARAPVGDIKSGAGVAWRGDGMEIFTANQVGTSGVRVCVYPWDGDVLGNQYSPEGQPSAQATWMSISPDGTELAVGVNSSGNGVFLYDVTPSGIVASPDNPIATTGTPACGEWTGRPLD